LPIVSSFKQKRYRVGVYYQAGYWSWRKQRKQVQYFPSQRTISEARLDMRICLYTETALPKMGGQELVVDALARQYQKLGQDVVVLAPYPRRLRTCDAPFPYPIYRHPRFFSTRLLVSWYRWWLLRLRRRFPFDVLHCHGVYPPGYLAALCRHRLGVPTIITSHGGDIREGNVRLAKPVLHRRYLQALKNADALVSISRFTTDNFRRLFPEAPRIVTIPNGVDPEPFSKPALRPENLDPRILPGEYVLFLGRLKNRKGVDLLLQALAQVPVLKTECQSVHQEKVQLVIAGDGEDRLILEALAGRLGLTKRACFVGTVFGSLKTYLLQNALCTVMPSREWEAFPLVVLESYAASTPVLATQIPGLADLIKAEQTGWLVPPESSRDLARVLTRILANPAAAHSLRSAALNHVHDFSWQTIARRHVQLYEELLTAHPKRNSA
jgi:glycosyltransferase involved in cell wall biosynthesis